MLRGLKNLILVGLILTIATVVIVNIYGEGERIQITGSTTVLPVAQRAAENFMKEFDITVSVRGGGSGTGIAALIDGRADIADASRPIKSKEIKIAKSKGVKPKQHIIARDGLAVVVNKQNSVDGLTLKQIKKIFMGEITNWKEVGGPDKHIIIISRDSSSGTFEAFKELALDEEKYSEDALRMASNKAVATTVARTKTAIGYIGMAYLSQAVKTVKVDGVLPTLKTAGSGKYKIARPLYMYTDGEPKGNIKKFIDYVFSPAGQKIVKKVGYVPVK